MCFCAKVVSRIQNCYEILQVVNAVVPHSVDFTGHLVDNEVLSAIA